MTALSTLLYAVVCFGVVLAAHYWQRADLRKLVAADRARAVERYLARRCVVVPVEFGAGVAPANDVTVQRTPLRREAA